MKPREPAINPAAIARRLAERHAKKSADRIATAQANERKLLAALVKNHGYLILPMKRVKDRTATRTKFSTMVHTPVRVLRVAVPEESYLALCERNADAVRAAMPKRAKEKRS